MANVLHLSTTANASNCDKPAPAIPDNNAYRRDERHDDRKDPQARARGVSVEVSVNITHTWRGDPIVSCVNGATNVPAITAREAASDNIDVARTRRRSPRGVVKARSPASRRSAPYRRSSGQRRQLTPNAQPVVLTPAGASSRRRRSVDPSSLPQTPSSRRFFEPGAPVTRDAELRASDRHAREGGAVRRDGTPVRTVADRDYVSGSLRARVRRQWTTTARRWFFAHVPPASRARRGRSRAGS